MKTTTIPLRHSMNRSPLRAFLLIPVALACFALSPQARAVCQEGCLTNDNTVLGDDALISNTSGGSNVGIGAHALTSNTTQSELTALGAFALASFSIGYGNTAVGYQALSYSTTIFNNTAVGWNALTSNTTGSSDVAVGSEALAANTIGGTTSLSPTLRSLLIRLGSPTPPPATPHSIRIPAAEGTPRWAILALYETRPAPTTSR